MGINAQQFRALLFDAEEGKERVIGILPFFHAAGFTGGMNHCIYRGFTKVLRRELREIEEKRTK